MCGICRNCRALLPVLATNISMGLLALHFFTFTTDIYPVIIPCIDLSSASLQLYSGSRFRTKHSYFYYNSSATHTTTCTSGVHIPRIESPKWQTVAAEGSHSRFLFSQAAAPPSQPILPRIKRWLANPFSGCATPLSGSLGVVRRVWRCGCTHPVRRSADWIEA